MSYIGKAPGFGIRNRYYYTATSSQTLFSGADDNGQTLAYADSKYLDVFLNGVSLVAGTDYTATTLTSVSLTTGAAASDIVEIVAYDIFSVADTVSAANGGTFSGAITVDADGATVATFDRATSDGDIVSFEKDGSTVGSIGSVSGVTAYIDGGSGFSGIQFGGDGLAPRDNGALADNTSDLGTSSYRFKDLYLSGGVYLGGTGSANYLDDYEEGTWTPVFGIVSGSATYTSQIGNYVKVGRMVTATFVITVNVSSSLVSGGVAGLPFAGSDTNYSAASFSSYETGAFSGYSNLLGLMANTATLIQLRGTTSATSAPTVLSVSITNGTTIAGSITYYTT